MEREELDRRVNDQLDREERERLARELEAADPRDTTLAIGSAVVQLVPGLGGAIGALINEYIPRRRQERMVEFVRELDKALGAVEHRVESAVLTDAVADVVEEVLERVVRAEADGKRAYYAAAVANTLAAPDLEADLRERMMDALDALRPSNLRLLALISENPPAPQDFNVIAGGIYEYLKVVLPGISQDQVKMDWADLANLNIVDDYPSGVMTIQGITATRGRLKDFGRAFIAWITAPAE
jgi:hypothetical protein